MLTAVFLEATRKSKGWVEQKASAGPNPTSNESAGLTTDLAASLS